MERFARGVIRHRVPILIITALVTAFLLYEMRYLQFRTVLGSILPPNHPFIRVHMRFQEMFGGASTTTIVLESTKGDIFRREFLEKLKYATDEIKFYDDAIMSQVISLSRKKVKNIRGTAGGLDIRAFFEHGVPRTEEGIAQLRENVFANEFVRGRLVSTDGKAALIMANFKEGIDYRKLFDFLQGLKRKVEQGGDVRMYMSGRPVLLGWLYHNQGVCLVIFGVSILAEIVLLYVFLRRFHWLFIPLPLVLAFLNAIWGLGVMGLARFNLDPLGLVIPFVIGARVISHTIQITERYGEHFREMGDKQEAAMATLRTMFVPSAASIATDAAGLFVLCLVPIPLLRTLGWVAGCWLLSAILGVSLLAPVLYTYMPAPMWEAPPKDFLERGLEGTGGWLLRRPRNVGKVIVAWLLVLGAAVYFARQVQVGDAHPGSPLLWPDSVYNRDNAAINRCFPGTDPLFVIVEGKHRDALKHPAVLRAIDDFERAMWQCPSMGGTESLVSIVKKLNREFHEGDPRWAVIPPTQDKIAFYLWMYLCKGEPGDFDRWADIPFQHGNVICYFKDHKGDTIEAAMATARRFLATYPVPTEHMEFKLAGGPLGVTAAVNEVVGRYADLTLYVALFVIFLCCVIPYKSLLRGFILLASLVTANFIALAYMALTRTGMTINVLPVASIGAGLGVDYGIYMLSRIHDELQATGGDLVESIRRAFPTTGRAVVVTGLTVIAGIVFWYFSAIRFQAEMGFLLAFLLAVNLVGAVLLVPALTYVLRPGFLRRGS